MTLEKAKHLVPLKMGLKVSNLNPEPNASYDLPCCLSISPLGPRNYTAKICKHVLEVVGTKKRERGNAQRNIYPKDISLLWEFG